MKRRKRTVVFAAVLLAVVSGLAGCAKDHTENKMASQEVKEETAGSSSKADAEEIAKAARITIEEFQELTEWKTMAKIKLGDQIQTDGKGVDVDEGMITISKGGSYTVSGTLTQGRIVVDTESPVRLLLNHASITSGDGPAIYGKNSEVLYIETVRGTKNTLADGVDYQDGKAALFSNNTMVLLGEGTLNITGNYKHAVCCDDVIYMEGGTVNIISAVKDGFHANDGICIDGGEIVAASVHDALESEGAFDVNGGTLQIAAEDDGLVTLGNMNIYGGKIQITACEEGLEAKNALTIHDGTIEITAKDDGINAGNELQICGGRIFADVSKGDGIDSNGTLLVSGGLTVAMGGQMPEGGIDCDERKIIITGGTLIACGGTNSAPSEQESSSVSLLLGSAKAGDQIGIFDEKGETVFCFKSGKDYSNMLLSTETTAKNGTYRIFTGGEIKGGTEFHGYYQNAVYQGGEESISVTADSVVVNAGGTAGGRMGGEPGGDFREGGGPGEPAQGGRMPEGEDPKERQKPENELPRGEQKTEGESF